MKKVTEWRPDTCSCVLRYEWDTEDDPEARKHTAVEHVYVCDAHVPIGEDHHGHLAEVLDENQHVNTARSLFGDDMEFQLERIPHDHRRVLRITKHSLDENSCREAAKNLSTIFPHRTTKG